MSMDGSRFGVGLAVGLILGVVVVAASAGLGISETVYVPAAATSTTERETVTSSATTTLTTTSGASTVLATGQGNATFGIGSTSTSSVTGNQPSGVNGLSSFLPSSRLASVASQGPTADALLIVPLVLAFLLGGALYKAATRKAGDGQEELNSS